MDSVQVDLWNQRSGEVVGAILSPHWDGRNAQLSIEAPELDLALQAAGPDLFAALGQLRKGLEPLGWVPLCNGARVDCHPSGMVRDMGGGASVYVLSAMRSPGGRLPLVGTFEPAPRESVGTVADQNAYYRKWIEARGR